MSPTPNKRARSYSPTMANHVEHKSDLQESLLGQALEGGPTIHTAQSNNVQVSRNRFSRNVEISVRVKAARRASEFRGNSFTLLQKSPCNLFNNSTPRKCRNHRARERERDEIYASLSLPQLRTCYFARRLRIIPRYRSFIRISSNV